MGPKKINVKDVFTDGVIDLSMSDLTEVPVKEILALKKAYSLDLSNNRISSLPPSFSSLTNIIKIDLSKNELTELPENFGDLMKLKHLDLDQNKLSHLPLSFYKLKDLKWLDLKDNPLVPTVSKIAGPCLDAKQCQKCAKDVVNFFVKLQEQVQAEIEVRNKKKQVETNNLKKQEEKMKKKEKKKVKAENKIEKPYSKQNASVNIVQKKSANKKSTADSSVMKSLFLTIFLIAFVLFVLTSIKFKATESVERIIHSWFEKATSMVPANMQPACRTFSSGINVIHQKTGNITLELFSYIKDKDWSNINIVLDNFLTSVKLKIQETYKSFTS